MQKIVDRRVIGRAATRSIVTANASFRIVGRLDAAESQRDEYGYLTTSARVRASILKPGSMFLQQPDVPVPLLVQFPFPAWATRADEVAAGALESSDDVFARISAIPDARFVIAMGDITERAELDEYDLFERQLTTPSLRL